MSGGGLGQGYRSRLLMSMFVGWIIFVRLVVALPSMMGPVRLYIPCVMYRIVFLYMSHFRYIGITPECYAGRWLCWVWHRYIDTIPYIELCVRYRIESMLTALPPLLVVCD